MNQWTEAELDDDDINKQILETIKEGTEKKTETEKKEDTEGKIYDVKYRDIFIKGSRHAYEMLSDHGYTFIAQTVFIGTIMVLIAFFVSLCSILSVSF